MKCPGCSHPNPSETLFCGMCGTALTKPKKGAPSLTKTLKIASRELAPGMAFAGRYQVIEDLGKGGMGHVYKVLDREVNEIVALKVLKEGVFEDEKVVERFHNELKLARRISHKNVCAVYHLSKDKNETYYITMEYVSGEDLKSLIHRIGQLSIGKAVLIAEQVCEGLAEAHRLGVVHRDLKPSNIMIDRDGHVRIMDFGIARSLAAKGVTDTHVLVGTPDYMSPEQIEGKDVDPRSDIYALGLVLYEMLTGRLPFEGGSALSVALKHKSQAPPSPKKFNPHIPDSLCHAVLKCLEKKREARFPNIESLRDELGRIEKALHLTTQAAADEKKTQKISRVIRKGLRWRTAVLVALVVGGGYLLYSRFVAHGPGGYDTYISLEVSASDATRGHQKPIEFVLNRALSAATKQYVFIREDLLTYKKKTESVHSPLRPAVLSVTGEIVPRVVGYEIMLTARFRGKTVRRGFDCKGDLDFLTRRVDDILAFLSTTSEALVGPIPGGAKFSQVCTSDMDALDHFLKGEDAWKSLEPDRAYYEYRTALENDPSFSLSHLRLADVLAFRSDVGAAKEHVEQALAGKGRLIELDLLRLYALRARLDFKSNEERQFLGQLTEAFPFKKEFHYEFAESYFHCGAAEEAIIHYLKALALDENYVQAHNHLAYCYSWIGNHREALRHFERAQVLDPKANSYDGLAVGLMFAGEYERALAVIEDGLKVDPRLDYLYANKARNQILRGKLDLAREAFGRQAVVTTREFTKTNVGFWLAFIEFLRGDTAGARKLLAPVWSTYRQDSHRDRLDESPNLPSWLSGIMAAQRGDAQELEREARWMEDKIRRHSVSSTNFYPVLKLYLHLKMLDAVLQKDPGTVRSCIEEGRQIRMKMGYRSSFFNLSYFYNAYADALTSLGDPGSLAAAKALLGEANAYNPHYPWTHVNLAMLFHLAGDEQGARSECALADGLLSGSDNDYVMMKAVQDLRSRSGK
ncbi:MAG: protein kinase domain-containing protein [Candidatus Aminicenantales bacterium]